MVALVTLARVKLALRIGGLEEVSGGGYEPTPHEDDDLLENVYIPAASQAVIDHLKSRAEEVLDLDSGGDIPSGVEVPEIIQVAVILLVKHWYDPTELRQDFEGAELPPVVKALLKPLRDPTLA